MEAYKEEIYKELESMGDRILPVKVLITGLKCECSILPHWHDYMEILYFYRGSAVVQINKEYIQVANGQIVLVDALDIHSMQGSAEYLVLLFRPQLATDFYIDLKKAFLLPDREKVLDSAEAGSRFIGEIARQMQEIREIHEEKLPGYEISIRGSIYKIVAALFAYTQERGCEAVEYQKQRQNLERLDRLLQYIDECYHDDISIEEAAKYLSLSPNYFCRFFKKLMGKTFVEYLNMYRCAKAEALICTTDRSITEIALAAGFSSISYFNRIYRKYKGFSPSRRRKEDNIVQQHGNI